MAIVFLRPRGPSAEGEVGSNAQALSRGILIAHGEVLIGLTKIRRRSGDGTLRIRRQTEQKARERVPGIDNPGQAGDVRSELEIPGRVGGVERIYLIEVGMAG